MEIENVSQQADTKAGVGYYLARNTPLSLFGWRRMMMPFFRLGGKDCIWIPVKMCACTRPR